MNLRLRGSDNVLAKISERALVQTVTLGHYKSNRDLKNILIFQLL